MSIFSWFRKALSPAKLTTTTPIVQGKPIWEQFQRIGGGLSPTGVSNILRQADGGQPARLVDLMNESRQRDGHIHSICSTRDRAVSLVDLSFIAPEDATEKETEAAELCRRVVNEFSNWPTLIEHLTSSYLPGHATAEMQWRKATDGLLLPFKATTLWPRDFIFTYDSGELRFARYPGDMTGVDLLAENPGRIVQIQRRIVGDVPVREGLQRILVWAALFRNWNLRDWISLGEIGWKPWRHAKYPQGTPQEEIEKLVTVLQRMGELGVGVVPVGTELAIEWPKGSGPGNTSSHRELFETVGRECSKAVLGQTTSIESGPHGTKSDTQVRDQIRFDIRESDARAVASVLREQLFEHVVALNLGPDVRCPVPWFMTEEDEDQLTFSQALKNLHDIGLRIPAKWAREEFGMPALVEGEEVIEPAVVQVPKQLGPGEDDPLDIPVDVEDPADAEPPTKATRVKSISEVLPSRGSRNGLKYSDDVTESSAALAAKHIAPTVAAMMTEIAKSRSYEDALHRVADRYGSVLSPIELKEMTEATLILGNLAGAAAVRQDTPELDSED